MFDIHGGGKILSLHSPSSSELLLLKLSRAQQEYVNILKIITASFSYQANKLLFTAYIINSYSYPDVDFF